MIQICTMQCLGYTIAAATAIVTEEGINSISKNFTS